MSQTLRRKIAEETLSPNIPKTIPLPRNYAIREIACKLKGSITITGGNTSGSVKDSTPLQFIRFVEVRREGKDTLVKIRPAHLHRINQIFYGTRPAISELANGNAQANTPVNGNFVIPFGVLKGISPIDTFLKAGGLSSLDLLIDVGQASDLIQGGDRNIAVGGTSFTIVVETLEEIGLDNWMFGDMRLYSVAEVDIAQSSSAFQIKPIPVGNEYYAFVLISEVNNLLSNSIINKIKLKSGSEVFFDVDAETLRFDNKRQFGVEDFPTGYYVLWLSPDGMLNSSLDVRQGTGRNTLEFELDVNGGSGYKIYVYAFEYIRPTIIKK